MQQTVIKFYFYSKNETMSYLPNAQTKCPSTYIRTLPAGDVNQRTMSVRGTLCVNSH